MLAQLPLRWKNKHRLQRNDDLGRDNHRQLHTISQVLYKLTVQTAVCSVGFKQLWGRQVVSNHFLLWDLSLSVAAVSESEAKIHSEESGEGLTVWHENSLYRTSTCESLSRELSGKEKAFMRSLTEFHRDSIH